LIVSRLTRISSAADALARWFPQEHRPSFDVFSRRGSQTMRSSMAYFAGAGTVIAAIAAGVSGGFFISSIVSPHPEKHGSSEVTKLERRMSPELGPAMNKGSPEPVPYLAAPQISAAVADPPAQPQSAPQQPPPAAQVQPQQTQPQPATQQASTPPTAAAPEESFAKARDAELKRDARRAEEKRKAERRQQWGERRKWRQRDDDDGELREVERRVREDTEPRRIREDNEPRPLFASEPSRIGMPRIRIFDMD
jgi:hypothetical protein